MQDMLCSIGAKLAESGVVVVIGVGLVFLILALLIGVISLLHHLNVFLETWDDRMLYSRARKSEIKKIKKANAEHFGNLKMQISESKLKETYTSEQYSEAIIKMKVDKAIAKAEFIKSKHIIKMKYGTVFNIRKERKFAIKKATKLAEKAFAETTGNYTTRESLKNAKMLLKLELNKTIVAIKEDFAVKIKAASEGSAVAAHKEFTGAPISNAVEVNNNALVAAITAAVAMMLECETQEKKVNFRVRNIREIK